MQWMTLPAMGHLLPSMTQIPAIHNTRSAFDRLGPIASCTGIVHRTLLSSDPCSFLSLLMLDYSYDILPHCLFGVFVFMNYYFFLRSSTIYHYIHFAASSPHTIHSLISTFCQSFCSLTLSKLSGGGKPRERKLEKCMPLSSSQPIALHIDVQSWSCNPFFLQPLIS